MHCFMTQFVPATGDDSLSCVTIQTPSPWRYTLTQDCALLDWHELQLNIQLVPCSKNRDLPNETKQIPRPCHVMCRLGPSASFDRFCTGHI